MSDAVVEPRPGQAAFVRTDDRDADTVSQVIQVLAIGAQLSGHKYLLSEADTQDGGMIDELEAPKVAPLRDSVTLEECLAYARTRHPENESIALAVAGRPLRAGLQAEARRVLWYDLRGSADEPSRQVAAVAFLRAALHSDDEEEELLRVAAASELTWQPGGRTRSRQAGAEQSVRSVLEAGLTSDSEDVRVMAGNALSGLAQTDEAQPTVADTGGEPDTAEADTGTSQPPGPTGIPGTGALAPPGTTGAVQESLIIHGTWANKKPSGQWWRPTGAFHQFLANDQLGTGLYAGDDPFEWSGNNSDHQRDVAGKALRWWVDRQQGTGWLKTAFAHSHGGTVLLSAAAYRNLRVDLMVALACPDYDWDKKPKVQNIDGNDIDGNDAVEIIKQNVPLIISVRAKHDPVLLADRKSALGKRRSSALKGIVDIELKGAGHAGVHDDSVWQNKQVAQQVLTKATQNNWSP
ncbi:hypothetical protein AB0M39_21840 [Streptomyces sp. NPDC051907]|uniref:hypothetical protein n=1 Tax=Streptomyces sp. NPDC051907 TaxID=3155284 RepID=UPI00343AE1B8